MGLGSIGKMVSKVAGAVAKVALGPTSMMGIGSEMANSILSQSQGQGGQSPEQLGQMLANKNGSPYGKFSVNPGAEVALDTVG